MTLDTIIADIEVVLRATETGDEVCADTLQRILTLAKQLRDGGERYQHYKGGYYIKLGNAEMESTGEQVVYYRGENALTVWVRPLSEWLEKFTYTPLPQPPKHKGDL
jgi:hypothetical protein